MAPDVAPPRGAADGAHEEAVRAIAARLASQKEELARRVVDRSVREIVDYGTPDDRNLLNEEFSAALEHVEVLVASLETGEPVPDEYLERLRQLAARRLHQGVPLEAFLHANRLWETVCWDAVLTVAHTDVPQEREAALEIGGRVLRLADRISTAVSHGYLDEITDRGLLRRDLLDALLTAKGGGNGTLRLARMLRLRLAENYVVVVLRGEGVEVGDAREQPPAARSTLDRIVEETRRNVRPSSGSLLTGMRNGDLVVLYPASGPAELDAVRQDCEALGAALGADVHIGISGWHEGLSAVGIAYAEAKDAVEIAATRRIQGHAVGLEEVLVDSLLHSSVPARRMLTDTLRPLANYDAARRAALVPTLRAYLDARLNVTKSAAALFVNPNTVVYRLRRIKELCGRDPHDPDDLLVLSLALKLADLRSDG
jgi:DNA-binding PucR family transcriptional regulator